MSAYLKEALLFQELLVITGENIFSVECDDLNGMRSHEIVIMANRSRVNEIVFQFPCKPWCFFLLLEKKKNQGVKI